VIQAASTSSIEQFIRLSVLNTSPWPLGINQRAHWNIDFAAQVAGIPYTAIRPAIFAARCSPRPPKCGPHGPGPGWPPSRISSAD
jgi:uncharacterized protein YbjT (DUF2867 family)